MVVPVASLALSPEPSVLGPVPGCVPARLRDRPQNMHLELAADVVASMPSARLTKATPSACWSSSSLKQVLEVAPEPVETLADKDIEPASLRIDQKVIQGRATVLHT